MEQLNERLNYIINTELEKSLTMIEKDLNDFYQHLEIKRGNLNVNGVKLDQNHESSWNGVAVSSQGVAVTDIISTAVEKTVAGIAGRETMIKVVEKGVTEMAKSAVGKTVLKKLGLKSLAPIITPIAPIINVLLIASIVKDVVGLFSVKKEDVEHRRQLEYQAEDANRKQQEALNQRMNALQELRTQLSLQLYKMEEETLKALNAGLTSLFDHLIAEIRADLDMLSKMNTTIEESISEINSRLTELEQFKLHLF